MNAHFDLTHIARAADELDLLLGGDDDERLFHDMLVGETNIDHIVSRIHEQIARDEEILVGIDAFRSLGRAGIEGRGEIRDGGRRGRFGMGRRKFLVGRMGRGRDLAGGGRTGSRGRAIGRAGVAMSRASGR